MQQQLQLRLHLQEQLHLLAPPVQILPAAYADVFDRPLPSQLIRNSFNLFSPGMVSAFVRLAHIWRTGISHNKNFLNPEIGHIYVTLNPFSAQ